MTKRIFSLLIAIQFSCDKTVEDLSILSLETASENIEYFELMLEGESCKILYEWGFSESDIELKGIDSITIDGQTYYIDYLPNNQIKFTDEETILLFNKIRLGAKMFLVDDSFKTRLYKYKIKTSGISADSISKLKLEFADELLDHRIIDIESDEIVF